MRHISEYSIYATHVQWEFCDNLLAELHDFKRSSPLTLPQLSEVWGAIIAPNQVDVHPESMSVESIGKLGEYVKNTWREAPLYQPILQVC